MKIELFLQYNKHLAQIKQQVYTQKINDAFLTGKINAKTTLLKRIKTKFKLEYFPITPFS
jgi:hypothetical protein